MLTCGRGSDAETRSNCPGGRMCAKHRRILVTTSLFLLLFRSSVSVKNAVPRTSGGGVIFGIKCCLLPEYQGQTHDVARRKFEVFDVSCPLLGRTNHYGRRETRRMPESVRTWRGCKNSPQARWKHEWHALGDKGLVLPNIFIASRK